MPPPSPLCSREPPVPADPLGDRGAIGTATVDPPRPEGAPAASACPSRSGGAGERGSLPAKWPRYGAASASAVGGTRCVAARPACNSPAASGLAPPPSGPARTPTIPATTSSATNSSAPPFARAGSREMRAPMPPRNQRIHPCGLFPPIFILRLPAVAVSSCVRFVSLAARLGQRQATSSGGRVGPAVCPARARCSTSGAVPTFPDWDRYPPPSPNNSSVMSCSPSCSLQKAELSLLPSENSLTTTVNWIQLIPELVSKVNPLTFLSDERCLRSK